jgi:hypothetical protein
MMTWNKKSHKFYVVRTAHFGMKLYNDQCNAQIFKFIYLFTSALHVSGFLLAHLQRQVYVQLRQWFKSTGYGVSARAERKPETFKAEVNR